MIIMEYTTNQKGLITELEVALYLIKSGYAVSQPLNADSKYDLILDTGKQLLRIQVKTSHLDSPNKIVFNCRSITGRKENGELKTKYYSVNDIDYFATMWNNQCYLIPVQECSARKALHLSRDIIRSNYSYAEDYIAEEVLKKL